jgi:hypothetical protein
MGANNLNPHGVIISAGDLYRISGINLLTSLLITKPVFYYLRAVI